MRIHGNFMLKQFIWITILTIFSSCNDSLRKNNSGQIFSTLEERANDFYHKDQYDKAKLCYDSLIALDTSKGTYYFKRAYCKSRLSSDDPSIIPDYLKAIQHNYERKQAAYLNIGVEHRFRAVFRCFTNQTKKAEYDTALYFYNECLRIDPDYNEALQEKQEVIEELRLLK